LLLRTPRRFLAANVIGKSKMSSTEDIRDIFSILHDGIIYSWTGDKNLLTLKIDCQYLAEYVDKSFDSFYVDLIEVDNLYLTTWPNPFNLPVLTLTDLNDIFKAGLEILSADIAENEVVVACNQHNTDFDYCGGNLTVGCRTIKIYDQNKNELTIDKLDEISKKYWNERRENESSILF
jgi:hypothetical protein